MPIRTRLFVSPAVLAVAVAATTLGTASAAAPASTGTPGSAVTITYTPAAQAAAASHWTPSTMATATGLGAASSGAASSGAAAPKPLDTPTPPPGIPNPVYFDGIRTVGALFFTTGTQNHFCTASVVNSGTFNLVLTAAHCVTSSGGGYAQNIVYVPQWHSGVSPYGAWPVQSITVTPSWQQSGDINADFAFLKVSPPAGQHRPIQFVTGGLTLGSYTGYDHRNIHVIGYNNTDSAPIICATDSFYAMPDQEEFYCNNYNDGTSGGPWILGLNPYTGSGIVFGDIGGFEQGGDYPWASYSSYYTSTIRWLWVQAQLAQR